VRADIVGPCCGFSSTHLMLTSFRRLTGGYAGHEHVGRARLPGHDRAAGHTEGSHGLGHDMASGCRFVSNSLLVESEAVLNKRSTVFGRAEWVQKSADDLVLDVPLASFSPDRRFDVSTLSLGYVGEIKRWSGATLGVGGMGTVNFIPEVLEPAYGSRAPLGLWVFVRLRPVHGPEMPMMNIPMGGMR